MKKTWIVVVTFLIIGFATGLAAGFMSWKQGSEIGGEAGATAIKSPEEQNRIRLANQRRRVLHGESEMRQGLRRLANIEGLPAAEVSLREVILAHMIEDMRPINGSSIYNLGICHRYSRIIQEYFGPQAKVNMLEIGPGINLGTGLAFAMTRANRYYGLDIYKDPDLFAAPQYENIVKLLTAVAPDQIKTPADAIMKVERGQATFDKERVEYLYPHQSYDIPLPDGTLDFVFSHSTFEHIADPSKTIAAIFRVLRRGGITAHHIDLRDHRNFSRPLEFLKMDLSHWNQSYQDIHPDYLRMNRWRTSDFKEAFEKRGFEVIKIEPTSTFPVTEAVRDSLDSQFRQKSIEDLSVISVMIVARKR